MPFADPRLLRAMTTARRGRASRKRSETACFGAAGLEPIMKVPQHLRVYCSKPSTALFRIARLHLDALRVPRSGRCAVSTTQNLRSHQSVDEAKALAGAPCIPAARGRLRAHGRRPPPAEGLSQWLIARGGRDVKQEGRSSWIEWAGRRRRARSQSTVSRQAEGQTPNPQTPPHQDTHNHLWVTMFRSYRFSANGKGSTYGRHSDSLHVVRYDRSSARTHLASNFVPAYSRSTPTPHAPGNANGTPAADT